MKTKKNEHIAQLKQEIKTKTRNKRKSMQEKFKARELYPPAKDSNKITENLKGRQCKYLTPASPTMPMAMPADNPARPHASPEDKWA